MCLQTLIQAVVEGDLQTAQSELVIEMNQRRDDLLEQGREFIAANIQDTGAAE